MAITEQAFFLADFAFVAGRVLLCSSLLEHLPSRPDIAIESNCH
jgi:hypothetical protein